MQVCHFRQVRKFSGSTVTCGFPVRDSLSTTAEAGIHAEPDREDVV